MAQAKGSLLGPEWVTLAQGSEAPSGPPSLEELIHGRGAPGLRSWRELTPTESDSRPLTSGASVETKIPARNAGKGVMQS